MQLCPFLLLLWEEKQHLKFPQTVKSIKKKKNNRLLSVSLEQDKNKAKDVMKGNTVWEKRWENHKEVHLRLRLIGRAHDCFLMLFSLLISGRHLPPSSTMWPSVPHAHSPGLSIFSHEGIQHPALLEHYRRFIECSSSCSGNWSPQCTIQYCFVSRHNNWSCFHLFKTTDFVKTCMPTKMQTGQCPPLGLTGPEQGALRHKSDWADLQFCTQEEEKVKTQNELSR